MKCKKHQYLKEKQISCNVFGLRKQSHNLINILQLTTGLAVLQPVSGAYK